MITFDPNISEINDLVQIIQTQNIYTQIFTVDLTSLNKEFNYTIGSQYKQAITEKIISSQKNNLLYYKILGGTILTITKKQITSDFKSSLQKYSETIIKNQNKKYFFISEETIPKISLNQDSLLTKMLKIEIFLSQKRENIQKELNQIKSEQEINSITEILKKTSQAENTIKIELKKENIKQLLQLSKNSYYLTQATHAYYKNQPSEQLKFSLIYYLWLKIQQIMLESYKQEKIYTQMQTSENNSITKKFKIQNEFIKDWFDSTIKALIPHMNQVEKKRTLILQELINKLSEKTEKEIKQITPYLINTIKEITNNIHVRGFQSITLDNFTPSDNSKQLISRQIFLQIGPFENSEIGKEQWKNEINKFYSQPTIKPEYKGFAIGNSSQIYNQIKYLNKKIIIQNPNQNIHLGFLEIDFFNAFNTYFFPNDMDEFYKKILDQIFETSNQFFIKYSELFKTLTIGVLGDEFFFCFLTQKELTKNQEKTIRVFLKLLSKEILKITKNKLLIKTEKKKIIDIDENELTIRVPMEKISLLNTPKLEIGKISISKYLLTNFKHNFNNSESRFIELYDYISQKMTQVKENKTKELLIENLENKTI